jgi:TRAP-type C4-dicarboxylate transport system permease small subunit
MLISDRIKSITFIISDLVLLGFIYFVLDSFVPLWQLSSKTGTIVQALRISELFFIFAIPLGFALMTVRTLQMLYYDVESLINGKSPYEGTTIMGGD